MMPLGDFCVLEEVGVTENYSSCIFFILFCSILVFLRLLRPENIAPVNSEQVQDFVFLSNMEDIMLSTNFTVFILLLSIPV